MKPSGTDATARIDFDSAMIAAGAAVTAVPHRLGHASSAIKLRVYSHFFKDVTVAADRLAEAVLRDSSATRKKWAESGPSNGSAAQLNRVSA